MLSSIDLNFTEAAEAMRLNAIRETGLGDKGNLPTFDRLTRLMKVTFRSEIAVISFVDRDKDWFLSRAGSSAMNMPRSLSFSNHIIASNSPVWVENARTDARFQRSPLVTKTRGIRSYLGVPLVLKSGITVGAVWVADSRTSRFAAEQIESLRLMADVVTDMISAQMTENDAVKKAAMLDTKSNHLMTVNRLLQSAESVAGIGSWSVSTDLQDLIWSPQTYILHERDPKDGICVREAVNFYKPEDRQMVSSFLAESMQNKSGYEFEAGIITAKGNERRIQVRGDYIRGTRWVSDRIVGVIQTI